MRKSDGDDSHVPTGPKNQTGGKSSDLPAYVPECDCAGVNIHAYHCPLFTPPEKPKQSLKDVILERQRREWVGTCDCCGPFYRDVGEPPHHARYLDTFGSPVVVVYPHPLSEKSVRRDVQRLLARADEAIAEAKASGVLIDFTAAHEALDDLQENGDDPYVYTKEGIEFMAKMRGMTVEEWVDQQIKEITRPSIFDDLRQAEKDGKPLLINRIGYGPRVKKEEQTAALQCAQSVEPCPYCLEVGLHNLSCQKHPLAVMGTFGGRKDSGIGRKTSETARAFKVYDYLKEHQPTLLKHILGLDE